VYKVDKCRFSAAAAVSGPYIYSSFSKAAHPCLRAPSEDGHEEQKQLYQPVFTAENAFVFGDCTRYPLRHAHFVPSCDT
jgi:hypothetical protein